MPSKAPRVSARVRGKAAPRAKARPLPRHLIDVYYLSEKAYRDRVRQLEEDPAFEGLVQKGILERVQLRGKIPRHKYEDFKDRELTDFFHKYQIERHPDWQNEFFDRNALENRHRLAKKYGCPVGELVRILRYCRYLFELSDGGPGKVVQMKEEAPDFLCFTPSDDLYDVAPLIDKIEKFSRRYELDQDQFAQIFFSQARAADDVAEELGCTLREVQLVRDMVSRIQTVNALQADFGPSRMADARSEAAKGRNVVPVAEIYLDPQGAPQLRVLADDLYDVKYRFRGDKKELSRDEQAFVQELKAVNQRKTVLVRLLTYLYKYQYRFFATGRPTDLLPLTQAKVAKDLQEEEATVSRLIRDKTLRTPWGTYPLQWGFVRVGKIVEFLFTFREAEEIEAGVRAKPFTDKEIQEILAREYGVKLSRRSITYHRNKGLKDSNFYARKRAQK